jgi:hypothetical protein
VPAKSIIQGIAGTGFLPGININSFPGVTLSENCPPEEE